jgi:hypothetical protein
MFNLKTTLLIRTQLASLGALRLGLLGLAVLDMLIPFINSQLALLSNEVATLSEWEVISTLVAPVMAPLLLVVIFIDVVMSRVRAADEQGKERKRFIAISRIELIVIGIMLAYWVPFFLELTK